MLLRVGGTKYRFYLSLSVSRLLLMTRSREGFRIDYKILHTTGEKVRKIFRTESSKMSNIYRLKVLERRNRIEVDEVIELNTIDDYDDLVRIDRHIDCLVQL